MCPIVRRRLGNIVSEHCFVCPKSKGARRSWLERKLKSRTMGICLLSMAVLVFASPGIFERANASACGSGHTYGTASWSPAPGKYVEITAIACGVGSGTFSSTHNQVKCTTSSPSSDWSFGSGDYDFIGYTRNSHVAYSKYVTTSNLCPNDSLDLGSTGTWQTWTGDGAPLYDLTVTYVPTGAQTTLSTWAEDCATSTCPV